MDYNEAAMRMHREHRGKIEIKGKVQVKNRDELSTAYTPGVAEPCREIVRRPEAVWELTARGNFVAVVSDGSAVLGLGDIGPLAAMPVMEGKALLFREFGGVDAVPICLDVHEPAEIISAVRALAPSFGGINLEDIAAPGCFEIEEALERELDIPVFLNVKLYIGHSQFFPLIYVWSSLHSMKAGSQHLGRFYSVFSVVAES